MLPFLCSSDLTLPCSPSRPCVEGLCAAATAQWHYSRKTPAATATRTSCHVRRTLLAIDHPTLLIFTWFAAADDDTRVPLQSGDNDYVNANFVKCDTGVGEFTYIASQVLRNLW